MQLKNFSVNTFSKTSSSLNSLSPYIGRLRLECAQFLIKEYAQEGKPIFDPFCGSGTVLLQGWSNGFDVYGNDLNPYAVLLAKGKTNPYQTINQAQEQVDYYSHLVNTRCKKIDLDNIPEWVKAFYHPSTLKEIIAWTYYLKRFQEWFLLSCLMGILHHQRPSFLSYPASHGAPYLRTTKYPREEFPEMYEYRNVYEKLSQKINRVYKNFPTLDFARVREVHNKDSSRMHLSDIPSGTIITSPPYMRSLTYARDNRLRLWFLGVRDCDALDKVVSPCATDFIAMMSRCIHKWANYQKKNDKCVIVIGDISIYVAQSRVSLAQYIEQESKNCYRLVDAYQDPIPESHKQVKGNTRIKREIIVVLERK